MGPTKNDGGPAFPEAKLAHNDYHSAYRGMTLRDYFAGQALMGMGLYSDYAHGPCNADAAKRAYALADAMLKAREADE